MKNTNIYAGYRYPSQIINYAVWLYHRFTLSFRDIEELLAAKGITGSYETVSFWCDKFGKSCVFSPVAQVEQEVHAFLHKFSEPKSHTNEEIVLV